MKERLEGNVVLNVNRRSKYILVELSLGETMIMHLGMSGRVLIHQGKAQNNHENFYFNQPEIEKHDHVIFDFEEGIRVVYNDPRRFGAIDVCNSMELSTHKMISNLGIEPLSNQFNADFLFEKFKGSKTTIKAALLNQRHVCGLGNIYVCEALWRSGISPLKLAGQIKINKIELLTTAIRKVLLEAISSGGSSLKDFKNTEGTLGYFQHNFNVYDSEGNSCKTVGCCETIKKIVQAGRSTFFCNNCQR
jgi:formamidopyrimidine-DNA glycosylase